MNSLNGDLQITDVADFKTSMMRSGVHAKPMELVASRVIAAVFQSHRLVATP
jgi:hypothetical protein